MFFCARLQILQDLLNEKVVEGIVFDPQDFAQYGIKRKVVIKKASVQKLGINKHYIPMNSPGSQKTIWTRIMLYRQIFVRSSSFCRTWGEHVVYKNCSECQKQFLYTTCSP